MREIEETGCCGLFVLNAAILIFAVSTPWSIIDIEGEQGIICRHNHIAFGDRFESNRFWYVEMTEDQCAPDEVHQILLTQDWYVP